MEKLKVDSKMNNTVDTTYFEGTFIFDHADNMDEYLKASGVNYIIRKIVGLFSSSVVVKQLEDGYWMAGLKLGPKYTEIKFRPGESTEVHSFQGKSTHVFTFEGSTIKEIRTDAGGRNEIIREYSAGGVKFTMTHSPTGVKCKGFSKRVIAS